MEPKIDDMLMELTAEVVSAYVSNNPVAATDLPNLIAKFIPLWVKPASHRLRQSLKNKNLPFSIRKSLGHGIFDLPGRWETFQVFETPP